MFKIKITVEISITTDGIPNNSRTEEFFKKLSSYLDMGGYSNRILKMEIKK